MIARMIIGVVVLLCSAGQMIAQDHKIRADEDWEIYKTKLNDIGHFIGWKRTCQQKPYDDEMELVTTLVLALTDTPSKRDLSTAVLISSANSAKDCSNNGAEITATLLALSAFDALDNFRRLGKWNGE